MGARGPAHFGLALPAELSQADYLLARLTCDIHRLLWGHCQPKDGP